MNKYLFLGMLQEELEKRISKDEVKDIIEYYDNYLLEAQDYGKSEEEIIAELGDVKTLAQSILNNLKNEEDIEINETRTSPDWSKTIDELSHEFSKAFSQIGETIGEVSKQIAETETFKDIFGSEDVEEIIDAEINEMQSINQEESFDLDDISMIQVELSNLSCHIELVESDQLNLKIIKKPEDTFEVMIKKADHRLRIVEKKARIYTLFGNHKRELRIGLPVGYKGDFKVDCANSAIKIEGNGRKSACHYTLECANGYVEVNRAILGHLDLDCKNGKVKLDEVIVYRANLDCKNGMITYHMLPNSYGKVLDVRCKNGVITVDGVHTTNGHYQTRIPSRNDSKHELSVVASCNNGIVKMKGFE